VVAEAIEVDGNAAFIGFEVSDTGIGIPLDKRHHIFEAFAQPRARPLAGMGHRAGL